MKRKLSRYLAAFLTSAMVLTGSTPVSLAAYQPEAESLEASEFVNTAADRIAEELKADDLTSVFSGAEADTGASSDEAGSSTAESSELSGDADTTAMSEADSVVSAEETASDESGIGVSETSEEASEDTSSAEETSAAKETAEALDAAGSSEEELLPAGVITEKLAEIGVPGSTIVSTGAAKEFQHYFPTSPSVYTEDMTHFLLDSEGKPDDTIVFQQGQTDPTSTADGAFLLYKKNDTVSVVDGVQYDYYVQYDQNPQAGGSGYANSNNPYDIGTELKLPTRGGVVVKPKKDGTFTMVGAQGSANRNMTIIAVSNDDLAGGATSGEVVFSVNLTTTAGTVSYAMTAGNTYYIVTGGTKFKFFRVAMAYSVPIAWDSVQKPTLDEPVLSEDGSTVDVTWHGQVGDFLKGEDTYVDSVWRDHADDDLLKFADNITVELRASQKFGSAYKAGDVVESQTFSSKATESTLTFTPPYSGSYYFKAVVSRTDTTGVTSTKQSSEKYLDNFVLPLAAPDGLNYNGMGRDAGTENLASINLSWSAFKEATAYKVYVKDTTVTPEAGDELNGYELKVTNESGDTTAVVSGLEIGKTYWIAVTSVRNEEESLSVLSHEPGTIDPVHTDKMLTNAIAVVPSADVTKNWATKGFGTGANKTPWSSLEKVVEQKGAAKGLWTSTKYVDPKGENSHDGYDFTAGNGLSDSKEDGLFTLAAVGNTGKVQDATHDGLLFAYTTIDPERENFTLSANVTLDMWDGGTGQEGFGLAALDRVPGTVSIEEIEDGDDYWNNEYLVGCTKIQYYWDRDTQKITTANPSDDNNIVTKGMRVGPGIVEKVGITKAMLDANLSPSQMGQNLTRNWYSLSDASGRAEKDPEVRKYVYPDDEKDPGNSSDPKGLLTDQNANLCGNIFDLEVDKDTKVIKKTPAHKKTYYNVDCYTNFDISLRRHNTGYTMEIISYDVIDGEKIERERHTETCWFPSTGDPLLRADPNSIYVGFFVARNATMTVNSYKLTTVNPEEDTPVEKVYPQVDPNNRVVSDLASTTSSYKYQFMPNAGGRLFVEKVDPVKDGSGNITGYTHKSWVGAGAGVLVAQDETASLGTSLKKGDNYFRYTFVPTNPSIKDPKAPNDDADWARSTEYTYSEKNAGSDYYQVSASYVPAATENLLNSYYPKQSVVNVRYGVLKTTKAKINGKNVSKVVYVSPDGASIKSDGTIDADGTSEKPYSLQTALNFALPGFTILMKEGTYSPTASQEPFEVYSLVSGTQTAHITLTRDPEAKTTPLIDVAGDRFLDNEGFVLAGSYWDLSYFDITNSPEGEEGLHVGGNYNTVEHMNLYRNRGSGVQVSRIGVGGSPSNNTFRYINSFLNRDKSDADADGFGMKLTIGEGNICEYCVAALNTDDGWDLYAKDAEIGAVTIRNCVAFLNGFRYGEDGEDKGKLFSSGNGNGFKMGGNSLPGKHRIINSMAFLNKAKGIDSNHCPDIIVNNCTSFNNGTYNFNIETQSWPSTNFFINGAVSWRTADAYANAIGEGSVSGNKIDNFGYLLVHNEDYTESKFPGQVFVRDNIELKVPQVKGTDSAVYGANNYYAFEGDDSYHNFTAGASGVTYVSDDWFENLDWKNAVNGYIYWTQKELGKEVFGISNEELLSDPEVKKAIEVDNKGFRSLENGTLDFGGFLALKPGHENTGATIATSHEKAVAADKALGEESSKVILATGIYLKQITTSENKVSPALMNEGDTVSFTSYVTPINANTYNSIKWYSENEDVAVVSAQISEATNARGVKYEEYTLTIKALSEGKTKIVGETGNGKKKKISVKVIQDLNEVFTGVVTKPSLSSKKVTLNSASLVPANFIVANGVNRTIKSVTLGTFKKGKTQLTAAQVQNFFELTYDAATSIATITMTPSDTDYGTDEFGKRVYKTSDDRGYARRGKYKGTLRVATVDSDKKEITYDYKFTISVKDKADQGPAMSLIQTADLSKQRAVITEDTDSFVDEADAYDKYVWASYRILSEKTLAPETALSETVTVVSMSQPSEIGKLAELKRPAKQKFAYFQKVDFDPEENILTLGLYAPSDGKGGKAVDKKVKVYVNYDDGTSGYCNLTVKAQNSVKTTGAAALKSSYSTAGAINVVSRGTTSSLLALGKAVEGKEVTIDENDKTSVMFGVREGDRVRGIYEIYALQDSDLKVGTYNVKLKVGDTGVVAKVKTVYAPGKVTPNPKKLTLNIGSEGEAVMTGSTPTKKWKGEVEYFSKTAADLKNAALDGGRKTVLIKSGTYKNVKLGKNAKDKEVVTFTLKSDITVADMIDETINYDQVELSAKSLTDASIVKKIGGKIQTVYEGGPADMSDEYTSQVIRGIYQKMTKQAVLQYAVIYKGQNANDSKQIKKIIKEKLILKEL